MAASRWCFAVALVALASWLTEASLSQERQHQVEWLRSQPSSKRTQPKQQQHSRYSQSGVVHQKIPIPPGGQTLQHIGNTDTNHLLKFLRDGSTAWKFPRNLDKRQHITGGKTGSNLGGKLNSIQWQRSLRNPVEHGDRKRWMDLFGGSSVETRFPLPERRQFPEVDWRGFNEDVFHESFGDFNPMKRWRKSEI